MANSELTKTVLDLLSDGEWVSGQYVLRSAMRTIPPGEASRAALRDRERAVPDREEVPAPMTELVEAGRRSIARRSIWGLIRRGRVETDVGPRLTRSHWSGELPFQLRDVDAGTYSIPEVAKKLDLTEGIVRHWIDEGYIPEPTTGSGGFQRVTPEMLTIYERVRNAWPGPYRKWNVDPRSLWDSDGSPAIRLSCPHCGHPVSVSLTKEGEDVG